MKFDDFLKHCAACGGNWTSMFMTGIKEVSPLYTIPYQTEAMSSVKLLLL